MAKQKDFLAKLASKLKREAGFAWTRDYIDDAMMLAFARIPAKEEPDFIGYDFFGNLQQEEFIRRSDDHLRLVNDRGLDDPFVFPGFMAAWEDAPVTVAFDRAVLADDALDLIHDRSFADLDLEDGLESFVPEESELLSSVGVTDVRSLFPACLMIDVRPFGMKMYDMYVDALVTYPSYDADRGYAVLPAIGLDARRGLRDPFESKLVLVGDTLLDMVKASVEERELIRARRMAGLDTTPRGDPFSPFDDEEPILLLLAVVLALILSKDTKAELGGLRGVPRLQVRPAGEGEPGTVDTSFVGKTVTQGLKESEERALSLAMELKKQHDKRAAAEEAAAKAKEEARQKAEAQTRARAEARAKKAAAKEAAAAARAAEKKAAAERAAKRAAEREAAAAREAAEREEVARREAAEREEAARREAELAAAEREAAEVAAQEAARREAAKQEEAARREAAEQETAEREEATRREAELAAAEQKGAAETDVAAPAPEVTAGYGGLAAGNGEIPASPQHARDDERQPDNQAISDGQVLADNQSVGDSESLEGNQLANGDEAPASSQIASGAEVPADYEDALLEIELLKEQLASQETKTATLEFHLKQARASVDEARKDAVGVAARAEVLESLEVPETPIAALELAERAFPDRLTFLPGARKSAKAFRKGSALEVWAVLRSIAVTLHPLIFEGTNGDVAHEFETTTGFELTLREMKQIKKSSRLSRLRKVAYKGTQRDAFAHVKGKGQKKGESLRVHFFADYDDGKIVIAHCGEHLPTFDTSSL